MHLLEDLKLKTFYHALLFAYYINLIYISNMYL